MVEQFLNHIHRHKLCKTTDKILLAVSGGVDSMVMLRLFKEAGIQFGVAHSNFQLRGEDSKADEALVNMTCVELGVPFYLKRFETEKYAADRRLSTQMAARELRYHFFEEVRAKHGYNFIATAHHLNDSLETVLLNLARGTGIDGLTGIPVRNGFVIRPMLFASRKEIEDFANFLRIQWREDKSNASDDYARNVIRNHVMPALRQINPSLEETYRNTNERIAAAAAINDQFVKNFEQSNFTHNDDKLSMPLTAFENVAYPQVLLWNVLRKFEFNFDQCVQILLEHQPGKKFLSATHTVLIDRDMIILYCKETTEPMGSQSIFVNDERAQLGHLEIEFKPAASNDYLNRKADTEYIDRGLLEYPLTWRPWRAGDKFKPLGMNGLKKVSDFLIDLKIPADEKAKITVLESSGKIVWVVGKRISQEFAVSDKTIDIMGMALRQNATENIS